VAGWLGAGSRGCDRATRHFETNHSPIDGRWEWIRSVSERIATGDGVEVYGDAELGLMLGSCRVVSVSGEYLVVAAPRFSTWSELNGHQVQLSRNSETGLFIGTAQVETETTSLGQLLRLRLNGNWRKVQRRENVRLPADLRIRQALLLQANDSEPIPLAVNLVNISASGCLMRVSPLPPLNARVRLTIDLPDAAPAVEVEAVAVRIEPDDRSRTQAGRLAVHFDRPAARTQDRIVRFIFKEQIRRLQAK
jgi:hypothetical protein